MESHLTAVRGRRLAASAPTLGRRHSDDPADRHHQTYHCPRGHTFVVTFAAGATPAAAWACPRCGTPAPNSPGGAMPPATPDRARKTHWEQLRARRSLPELEALLAEARAALRHRAS